MQHLEIPPIIQVVQQSSENLRNKKGLNDRLEALSPEYKAMWVDIVNNHPWVDKSKTSI